MAFLYREKDYEKLSDEQMIIDVLVTHNKISADIRDILWSKGIINFSGSTHLSVFELSRIFTNACLHDFINRNKTLINLDSDYSDACLAYENFIIPHISDHIFTNEKTSRLMLGDELINITKDEKSAHLRILNKYKQYSKPIDKWYDFFMLPLDEKVKLLCPKK